MQIRLFCLPTLMALMVLAAMPAEGHTDLPIRAVTLDNGLVLYSIPITVGGTMIEAGLDTGSTGIRVLPGTLQSSDAVLGSRAKDEKFSSGVRYQGHMADAKVTLGDFSAQAPLEIVQTVDCDEDKPDCPATKFTAADYGVRGDSLTAGRFRAIFGTNSGSTVPKNPLLAMGVTRWIVQLPRAGETGHLILDPSDDEMKDFTRLPTVANLQDHGALQDTVNGCFVIPPTKEKACGPLLFDSGAPNIRISDLPLSPSSIAPGQSAAFVLYDAKQPRMVDPIILGLAAAGTRSRLDRSPNGDQHIIFAGTAPYQSLDVLYDPSHSVIGVRPRPAAENAPAAQTVAAQ